LSSLFIFSPPLYIFNIIFSTWGTSVFCLSYKRVIVADKTVICDEISRWSLTRAEDAENKGI
ncbi:MAG: hypothetical protein K6U11_14280, partial [bacterium]|nr:hypothetical protein [bacterium]